MKYVRFLHNDEVNYGLLENEEINILDGNFIGNEANKTDEYVKLADVKLLSPLEPRNVICIGLNYALHAKEAGKPIPEEPMLFMVSPSAVIGDQDNIKLPNLENRIDFEAELVVVIGKEASQVKAEDALSYVFGYTCGNDVSDRNLQKNDGQFTRAKSFPTFKPLGPVINTSIADPNNLEIKLTVNNEVKQHSNTNDLIHNIEDSIEAITAVMTLVPGDIIMTGTPSGVDGMKPGDLVEIEIEDIGKLANTVTS